VSTFGDFDADDALDHEPADPEQVARKLHLITRLTDELAGRTPDPPYDDLTPEQQAQVAASGYFLVEWLSTHSPNAADVAEALHERRVDWGSGQPAWDDLSDDERALATALVSIVIQWLQREGDIA
jgi:hypothetical protein